MSSAPPLNPLPQQYGYIFKKHLQNSYPSQTVVFPLSLHSGFSKYQQGHLPHATHFLVWSGANLSFSAGEASGGFRETEKRTRVGRGVGSEYCNKENSLEGKFRVPKGISVQKAGQSPECRSQALTISMPIWGGIVYLTLQESAVL